MSRSHELFEREPLPVLPLAQLLLLTTVNMEWAAPLLLCSKRIAMELAIRQASLGDLSRLTSPLRRERHALTGSQFRSQHNLDRFCRKQISSMPSDTYTHGRPPAVVAIPSWLAYRIRPSSTLIKHRKWWWWGSVLLRTARQCGTLTIFEHNQLRDDDSGKLVIYPLFVWSSSLILRRGLLSC